MVDTPSSLPLFTQSPSFPLEGQLRVKRLESPVLPEPAREGEDPSMCVACSATDDAYIWVSERWRVRATDAPTGLPMVLILESRSHLDLGDLPNLLAAELGVMTVRLERAIRSLDEVAQVHVNRWGDGAAHLHLWFLGRPIGQLQLRGPFLAMWDEILEPVPDAQWRSNLAHIAAWLEGFGGNAQVAPPRIEWHAPSTFAGITAVEDPSTDVSLGNAILVDGAVPGSTVADENNAGRAALGPVETADAADPVAAGAPEQAKASDRGEAQDWTTLDYDETDVDDGHEDDDHSTRGRPGELASDNSEAMAVSARPQAKRVSPARARARTQPSGAPDHRETVADDTDYDLASDSR